MIVDYYSFFVEVDVLGKNTMAGVSSTEVIRKFKQCFARYGIVDELVTDNGSVFVSREFNQFCKDWNVSHVTSSPHHQQSNGLA